jgi:hypothetical protein
MRKQKALIKLLRELVDLLSDESDRNPAFAKQLEALLSALPGNKTSRPSRMAPIKGQQLPDVYVEFAARGEADFRLWLRVQPIEVLRAIARLHDLDAKGRMAKWKDPEKVGDFIADQIRSRRARGSSFLTTQ